MTKEEKVNKVALVTGSSRGIGRAIAIELAKSGANVVINNDKNIQEGLEVTNFFPSGSDERQFCSPGFDLPVGSLMRTVYGRFPEYHTSADNLDFVAPEYLADSLEKYIKVICILENNVTYMNLNPKCEPQLGRRGLYRMIGSQKTGGVDAFTMFWVLNLSDGTNTLLDISIRSGMSFEQIKDAADALFNKGLLKIMHD